MKDILFSESFHFRTIKFGKYHHTDNRHGAPEHYFAYMLKGKCKIVTDLYSVEINEGDFLYIPDKLSYQSYWYGSPKSKFISLGFGYFPNTDRRKYPAQAISFDEESAKMFLALADTSKCTFAAQIGTFYTLVGRLLPRMTYLPVSKSQEIVEKVTAILSQNPYAKTAEIAQECAVCESALYAAFKKISTVTLNTLRTSIKLENAKDMLITTDKSVEYISNSCGFSSASYFRKKFKEHFSLTPKEMRNMHKI